MAKQEVGLKIDVDVKSVGNMKQQLRAATNELIEMNERFGSSSKEATEAARRVAQLKDSIGDAKALADTFNPDKKFVALGGAVQGAVAGFSALQGAVGLFGDKSKEVEEVLLKVQSAMALQQGISGVFGAIDSFKLLGGVIKTQVVAAFTTLRGAMMATGIGLITSAVAFLVTNFDAVKKKLGELFPVLAGTGDLMDRLKQVAMGVGNAILQFLAAPVSALIKIFQGDFKGAIDSVKNGFAFVKNFREGEKKEIESQAAEAEEARQKELEKQKAANDKKLAEQRRINEELRKERERAEKELTDFIKAENEKRLLAGMSNNEKELFEFRKKFAEKLEAAQKYNLDTKGLEELRFNEGLNIINKQTAEERINAEKRSALSKFLISDSINDLKASLPVRAEIVSNIVALQEKQAESTAKLTEAEIASRQQLLASSANVLSELSSLFGESTAAGKAAALAEIIINTGLGFANGLRIAQQGAVATGPAAPFAFPIFYATQVAAVLSAIGRARQILTQVKGGGGGGGVPSGGGGITTTAPVTPALAPQVVATQVNTAAVNQMGNRAARAYVLNSDIQNDNQRNAYIDRSASIG